MKVISKTKLTLLMGLVLFNLEAFSQNCSITDVNCKPGNFVVAKTPEEDALVTKAIERLIKERQSLAKFNIKVNSHHGLVTLRGNVDYAAQADTLIQLAESVIGVSDVDASKLTIKSSKHPLRDAIITAKIKGILIREKLLRGTDVAAINTTVETKDRVVYLSGVVDDPQQINNAISVIKKHVPEVKRIEYHILVNP